MEVDDDRHFSMSIGSLGPSTLPRSSSARAYRIANDASEVENASRTTTQYERFSNKPSFLQSDIIGSTSKPLTRTKNTRDNCLYTDDIDGARPRVTDRMMITKRRVNPLQPEYDLPSFETVKPYEPKFIRHTMDFTDIEGTQSKPLLRFAPRDSTNKVDDIIGAQANWRSRIDLMRFEREPKEIMRVDDISKRSRYVDKTDRKTDLMNPVYQMNGMVSSDDPRYTKPKKPMPYFRESALLLTKDINAGPDPKGFARREFSKTNYIADIEGSESDSIKHSIVTTRITNPLVPVYQSLDYGDPLPSVLDPLMPSSMVFAPILRPILLNCADIKEREVTQPKSLHSIFDTNRSARRISTGESKHDSSSGAYYDNYANNKVGNGEQNDQRSTGYYESKALDNVEMGGEGEEVDMALFTEQHDRNQLEREKSSTRAQRYRLDLEGSKGTSSRCSKRGNNDSTSTCNYTNRECSNNITGQMSLRSDVGSNGDFKVSSSRSNYRNETARSGGGKGNHSARTPSQLAGEKRNQRTRQEEIDSVRNL